MTTKEAFDLLDRVTANVQGTRQDHTLIVTAIQTIGNALFLPDPEPKPMSETAKSVDNGHVVSPVPSERGS